LGCTEKKERGKIVKIKRDLPWPRGTISHERRKKLKGKKKSALWRGGVGADTALMKWTETLVHVS